MALTDAVKLCLEINRNMVVWKGNKAAICECVDKILFLMQRNIDTFFS